MSVENLPNDATVFDIVTKADRHYWREGGKTHMAEHTFLDYRLEQLSRLEFLRAISDAIEDRIKKERGIV